jgi:hypothetical protein
LTQAEIVLSEGVGNSIAFVADRNSLITGSNGDLDCVDAQIDCSEAFSQLPG